MTRGDPWAACALLAGAVFAHAALERRDALIRAAAPARAPSWPAEPEAGSPDDWTPRELRALDGIGPARALAIARARWERGLSGGPESWDSIHGIGPKTIERARTSREEGR